MFWVQIFKDEGEKANELHKMLSYVVVYITMNGGLEAGNIR